MRKPRLLAVVAGALLTTIGLAMPAQAHMGGKVSLFLKDLTVQPGDGGYNLTAVIVDSDSGTVATGYQTSVSGASASGGTFPATTMTPEQNGIYRATIPAEAGTWTVTLQSVAVPGVADAVPLQAQKQLAFGAGSVVAPATPLPAPAPGDNVAAPVAPISTPADDGGDSSAGAIVALLAVVALAGVGGVLFARRRRPAAAL